MSKTFIKSLVRSSYLCYSENGNQLKKILQGLDYVRVGTWKTIVCFVKEAAVT